MDPAFINYLTYLKYWQKPEYAIYIAYPYCLEILNLLQYPEFRTACLHADTATFLHKKEYAQWQYLSKRQGVLESPLVSEEVASQDIQS